MEITLSIPDPDKFKEASERVLEKATPRDFLSSEGSVYQDQHRLVSSIVKVINDKTGAC
jgi:hypothetical protein